MIREAPAIRGTLDDRDAHSTEAHHQYRRPLLDAGRVEHRSHPRLNGTADDAGKIERYIGIDAYGA